MPNPTTNFRDDYGTDLGNKLITKEYLMTVYPQIAANMITPELWVWGNNVNATLGTNDTINKSTPVTTFAGGANWKQVSCANLMAAAIKNDGTLWTWGTNSSGQLGINDTLNRTTPVTTFAGGTNWKQVVCAGQYILAIKTDGTLWSWGNNGNGQLGTNDTTGKSTPVTTFAGGTNWKQVAGGGQSVAIKTDGTLWVWGRNYYGQLGTNESGGGLNLTGKTTPVTTFAGGTNWKQVSCGRHHTAAIKTDGTLWVFGFNTSGGLGTNDITHRLTPVTTFAGGTNWKQVSAAGYFTSAIKTDGTLWTWGVNSGGGLGTNDTGSRLTPVTTFVGGTNWKQVAGGFQNNVISAIKTDGTLWTWGKNSYAYLGINNTTDKSTPVTTFAGGTNWKQIVSGGYCTLAIKTSDDLLGI
jgi:hypothetical protein